MQPFVKFCFTGGFIRRRGRKIILCFGEKKGRGDNNLLKRREWINKILQRLQQESQCHTFAVDSNVDSTWRHSLTGIMSGMLWRHSLRQCYNWWIHYQYPQKYLIFSSWNCVMLLTITIRFSKSKFTQILFLVHH